jgi:hypothetical protein
MSISKMDIDINKQINAIKKLIPSADGERLDFLTDQLHALLKKKQELAKSRPILNQVEEDIVEEPEVPSLPTQEKLPVVKIENVDHKSLK